MSSERDHLLRRQYKTGHFFFPLFSFGEEVIPIGVIAIGLVGMIAVVAVAVASAPPPKPPTAANLERTALESHLTPSEGAS